VFRGVSVLLAPARPAFYFCLLKPSSMKRRISSAVLIPVLFDMPVSLAICCGDIQTVVRFIMTRVWITYIRLSSTIFWGLRAANCLTIRCNGLRISA
jgi:hypothetical protein